MPICIITRTALPLVPVSDFSEPIIFVSKTGEAEGQGQPMAIAIA